MGVEKRYRLDVGAISLPVSVDDVKRNLHIRTDDDDTDRDMLLEDLIEAAVMESQNNTGLQYCPATYTLMLNKYPDGGIVEIEKGPVIEIVSIGYYADGATEMTVLDEDDYELDNSELTARLRFKNEFTPDDEMLNPIQIQFTCGFSATGSQTGSVPYQLRQAVILRACGAYLNPMNDAENFGFVIKIRSAEVKERDYRVQRF